MTEPWVRGKMEQKPVLAASPWVAQVRAWSHEDEGVRIPMPKGKLLAAMRREDYQRVEGDGLGPVTKKWEQGVFAWAKRL